ncbi:MAG TPA: 23S rRNA (guanosine(2251)-2'-O)-methyltransferase RlmB [Candidatus Saccharicenans sp.]|nr:23S rRNA (guanosine(2251)-2'-O)-methyltransferase RlmB [Candidatus Saccharicenans sp.]HOP60407.1 23S rRNA (guanosine(2251)-2'-O)-methyltransferase RlmB [Candidatus Saccharicenans sp.]HPP23561.1 23S rRNA (guanosine(2251)-2'-O)-methyltransferase RlmB [Candidatus Saccharicenans sp.]
MNQQEDRLGRINAIIEYLHGSPQRVNKIFVQKEKGHYQLAEIIRLARENHIPVIFAPRDKLDSLCPHHQGAVALVAEKEYSRLEDLVSGEKPAFLVMLDGVEDPQNIGAIVRSAEGAGANGLILQERHSAGLTPAVASVSAGAIHHLQVARVTNLSRSIDWLKEQGIWVVGAAGESPMRWFEFDFTLPVTIILGSEGSGLRANIRKKCDALLSLPMLGQVKSLNVGAAAAVFFYEVVRQRLLTSQKK